MHNRGETVGDDEHRGASETLSDGGGDLCVHPVSPSSAPTKSTNAVQISLLEINR